MIGRTKGKCEICGFEGEVVLYIKGNVANENATNSTVPLPRATVVCHACAFDLYLEEVEA